MLISLFFLTILLLSICLFVLSFIHSFILRVTLFKFYVFVVASLRGRAVYGVSQRPLARWDCGFDTRRGHGVSLL